MKLTTLDVLIITAFTTQETITLPRTTFDKYSNFVKNSPLFSIHYADTNVDIRVHDYAVLRKRYSYWRYRYIQDRVVPFEQNGFGAVRLLENARTFSSLSAMRSGWWDLETDTYYLDNKAQPRSGLCWAWDWFIVSRFIQRKFGRYWYNLGINLRVPQQPRIIIFELPHFQGQEYPTELSNGIYCCLLDLRKRVIDCPPFKWVERSNKLKISNRVFGLSGLSPQAKQLLFICLTAPSFPVSIETAYAQLTGRKIPRKNKTKPLTNKHSSKDRKLKALANARDELQTALLIYLFGSLMCGFSIS